MLLQLGHVNQDRFERSSAYLERALVAAERAGDRRRRRVRGRVPRDHHGLRPGARRRGDRALPRPASTVRRPRRHVRRLLRHEAVLHAMQGRIDEARALHAEADRIIDDLGSPWLSASTVFGQWPLEMLAGAPERAEAAARASLELLEEMGATNQGSTAAALLAVRSPSRTATRRPSATPTSPRRGPRPTTWPRRFRSSPPARTSSRRAASSSAPRRPRAKRCDSPSAPTTSPTRRRARRARRRAGRAGRASEAAAALRDAIALYQRKGNVVSAARAHTSLERFRHGAAVTDA